MFIVTYFDMKYCNISYKVLNIKALINGSILGVTVIVK